MGVYDYSDVLLAPRGRSIKLVDRARRSLFALAKCTIGLAINVVYLCVCADVKPVIKDALHKD